MADNEWLRIQKIPARMARRRRATAARRVRIAVARRAKIAVTVAFRQSQMVKPTQQLNQSPVFGAPRYLPFGAHLPGFFLRLLSRFGYLFVCPCSL